MFVRYRYIKLSGFDTLVQTLSIFLSLIAQKSTDFKYLYSGVVWRDIGWELQQN